MMEFMLPADEPFSQQEHRRTWDLLPWIANGTASIDQRGRAAAHLLVCAECRAELQVQQELQLSLLAEAPAVPVNSESILQRLFARLDEPRTAEAAGAPAAGTKKRSRLTAVVGALIVAQAVGLGVLGVRKSESGVEGYRTLSQEAATSREAVLRVTPKPAVSLSEWDGVLQTHGLQVVDGPNAAGAFDLALVPGVAEPLEARIAGLRQSPGIASVEVLASNAPGLK